MPKDYEKIRSLPASKSPPSFEMPQELLPYLRQCWKPITEARATTADGSKFCGSALIPMGEKWPSCGNCAAPLRLFVQLRSTDLPVGEAEAFGEGILQFFYCTSSKPRCEVDAGGWAPFGKSTLARVLPLSTTPVDAKFAGGRGAFQESSIVSWQPMSDVPDWEELRTIGIDLDDATSEQLSEEGLPRLGDKLLGWPAWIQGIEYPPCPRCNKLMKFVFQIDSQDNVPYMFGDAGIGHLFQCPEHRDVLGFGWAGC